ncbi:putative carboxylesterase 3 [Dendrobium catenatum]|uniref:Putative carboxylesterase 3 n=1 Tax=Dendrobium catenatum TaxID=906689 RepID=A0A2I0VWQ9_9ASPA|nr:putative carboxylesterase 3 [Dendrobium catenatum]
MKQLPILLYYHGGAFCVMSSASAVYHNYLNSLAAKADVLTVSVNYRLAPKNPLPAAYDDSWEALRWVVDGTDPWLSDFENLGNIILAGNSAGGNISHNLGLKLGSAGMKVEGLVLIHSSGSQVYAVCVIYPCKKSVESYETYGINRLFKILESDRDKRSYFDEISGDLRSVHKVGE